jgi:hypothetical protein
MTYKSAYESYMMMKGYNKSPRQREISWGLNLLHISAVFWMLLSS